MAEKPEKKPIKTNVKSDKKKRRMKPWQRRTLLGVLIVAILGCTLVAFQGPIRDALLSHAQTTVSQGIASGGNNSGKKGQEKDPLTSKNAQKIAKRNGDMQSLQAKLHDALKKGNRPLAERYQKQINKMLPKDTDYDWDDVDPMTTGQAVKTATAHYDAAGSAGVISVPAVKMYLPVGYGVANHTLSVGLGTMKRGEFPGRGNYALAGHYLSTSGPLASPIRRIKKGDLIYISDMNTVYIYKTYQTFKAADTATWLVNDTTYKGSPITTLITCADYGYQRYVARGYMINAMPATKSNMKVFKNLYY